MATSMKRRDRPARRRSALRRGNFAARMRMSVLYDRSVTFGGLVVGTGNKTEALIGYTTLFGDSASAFNPIGDLYKSQVRQLAVAMGVPDAIVRKPPSADLWPGQTDETEGGFQLSGPRPAPVLAGRQAAIDRRDGRARVRGVDGRAGGPSDRRPPSSNGRCRRSPSSGRGRRAWITCTRAAGRGRPAADDRGGERERRSGDCRRDPVRGGGRDWHLRLPWGWNTGELGPMELRGYTDGAANPDPGELRNPQVEPICRKYLELRYRLLPYIYTAARECTDTGLPMIRALWLHHGGDRARLPHAISTSGAATSWSRPSSRKARPAAASICRAAPGSTTGRKNGSKEAAMSIAASPRDDAAVRASRRRDPRTIL